MANLNPKRRIKRKNSRNSFANAKNLEVLFSNGMGSATIKTNLSN